MRIGIFSESGYDIISSPFVNTVAYLNSLGHELDIYLRSSNEFPRPDFKQSRIHCIIINYKFENSPFLRKLSRYYKLFQICLKYRRKKYDFVIGFDQRGLMSAAIFGIINKVPYIYHSLEIVSINDKKSLLFRIYKYIEIIINKFALLTITQDDIRAELLCKKNKLSRDKIHVVYNSSIGEIVKEKHTWLKDKLNIPKDKTIVLCVGSLIEEHMVKDLVMSALNWPTPFVLVLHGWFSNSGLESEIRDISVSNPKRIYISDQLLPIDQKYKVFQSTDIGLAFYKPINNNFLYVGYAAGKIFEFMKCGVPIIVNDLPGMKELVEDNHCGVVSSSNEIGNSLETVFNNYNYYSSNCFKTFPQYDFAKKYNKVLDKIITFGLNR